MVSSPLPELPAALAPLRTLALDLRWTWSHEGDALWERIDQNLWRRTQNSWIVLQNTSEQRLQELAADPSFMRQFAEFVQARETYLKRPGWFPTTHGGLIHGTVAYFSMEFGLGAAMPLYAGGLGVLAGDYLKTASDLDVPVIGIGLLYQEGYFRQIVDADGMQQELFPYNEPAAMPIEPVIVDEGSWLRVPLMLPGRVVQLRVWKATVGRVTLYLLDSNDPLNSPVDRGITAKLYGGGNEIRLMQEIVLGVGGWRVAAALHPDVEICHINEGHAAFAIIERARHLAVKSRLTFWEALWATRAGNVFTTHTPVAAGFDAFPSDLLRKYLPYVEGELIDRGVTLDDLLGLGRVDPQNSSEPFKMAYLAQRGSALCLGVSRLHGEFSRRIFQPLFPRWPACEVPVGHVTNGVHIPTWDSAESDRIWTDACGKERWRTLPADLGGKIGGVPDEVLWAMRGASRQRVVRIVRSHLAVQLRERGLDKDAARQAESVFDPNVLTVGFARRFTEYKRPNLLLHDLQRLDRLLVNDDHPMQIVVAGKAHPQDMEGKAMIQEWIILDRQPRYRQRIVFLEDYDIALAQELVQGVDVWINTPRRPWEACGTSGMKVLVNGGLNCSILDGWWDEAYGPGVGWAVGDGRGGGAEEVDAYDAESLYDTLEHKIIPEFYDRDVNGIPRRWVARIRKSMSMLTPVFGSARMLREYVEKAYAPIVVELRERLADDCAAAKSMRAWSENLQQHWSSLHISPPAIVGVNGRWRFSVPVFLGEVSPDSVRVELFADEQPDRQAEVVALHQERSIPGTTNGYVYAGDVGTARPSTDYTVRIVPYYAGTSIPSELPLIAWQR